MAFFVYVRRRMKQSLEETSMFKKNIQFLAILALFISGIVVRMDTRLITPDMSIYYIPWFRFIRDNGILSFRENFSHYSPLFNYLLAITTLADSIIPKVTAIKLISIAADLLTAFTIFRIVRIKYSLNYVPFIASGLYLLLPTVFVNSAIWGQTDSLYTLFLVISLFFILKNKPVPSMLSFGLAFSLKLQAVFFLPFIIYLLFYKKIFLWQLFLVPLVYVVSCIPILMMGGDFFTALGTYFIQVNKFQRLSGNAPNIFIFVSKENYRLGLQLGLIIAVIVLTSWFLLTISHRQKYTKEWLVLLALVSVVITPSILPKMYDRYFYPADVISLITAFYIPELWFIPILFQVSSCLAYSVYLLGADVLMVKIASIINIFVLGFLLYRQLRSKSLVIEEASSTEEDSQKINFL